MTTIFLALFISSVGCLNKLTIRLVDGESILEKDGCFEIVGITGTLSPDGVHIHISVSDEFGNIIGGHLKNGCIVNQSITKRSVLTPSIFGRG